MTEPLSTVCEHCDAKLKLKNPDLEGKKIKCPKCGEAFVVIAASTTSSAKPAKKKKKPAEDDDLAFMDVDPDDYGAPPDEDGAEDYDADEPPRQRSLRSKRGGKSKSKKKSRSSGDSAQVVKILAIVLVVLAVLAGGGYGMMQLTAAGPSDLDWLPSEIQGYVKLQVDNIWSANVLQTFKNGAAGQSFVTEMTKNVGLGPQDIDQIIVGINSTGAKNSEVMVVKASKPLDLAVLKGADANLKETSFESGTYLKGGSGVLFLADQKTLIVGPETAIQALITRGKKNPSDSKFGFARGCRDHVVVAMLDPDKSATTNRSMAGPAFLRGTKMAIPLSLLVRANAGSDIRILAQIAFKTSEESKASVDKNKTDFEKAKADFAAEKAKLQSLPPNPFMKPEQVKKMMDGMEQIMNNMQISQSGTRMNVNLTIGNQMINDVADMIASSPFAQPSGLKSLLPSAQ